jgi:hypothetical protein
MAKYAELLHEMKKQDSLLLQHITDMESFELTSKQNRQKVLMGKPPFPSPSLSLPLLPLPPSLSGNSKALVDEEKFRKSGKKKFEIISEKLLEAARAAQACSAGFPLDISRLSNAGQDLLRGKIQERTELMHLHTMTHGAKRWSGDMETNSSASSSHEDPHGQGAGNENALPAGGLNESNFHSAGAAAGGGVGNPTPGKKISQHLGNKKGSAGVKKEPSSRTHPTASR